MDTRMRNTTLGVIALLSVLILALLFLAKRSAEVPEPITERQVVSTATISDGTRTVPVELAQTARERTRGLSGRASLPEDTGLLFFFDEPARYDFWMPDMHFAIDIIWIDEGWEIVDISRDVSPDTYPKTFAPSASALYVLEVNAGKAKAWGWDIGTALAFDSTKT